MNRLDSLVRTLRPSAPKIIVYGPPGVGKTTFAASAKALLMDCENGAGVIPGLVRTPYLETWPEMQAWLTDLRNDWPAECRVLAIDTIDWMLQRITEHVCIDLDKKSTDEDITKTLGSAHGGYFKAREIVENIVFRHVLPALNAINAKNVPIILLAHAESQKLTTPEGYDIRIATPAIGKWILPPFTEWADAILYAHQETEGRMVTTSMTNTITAKNRYSLPPLMRLDWDEIAAAIRGVAKQPAVVAAESELK